MTPDAPLDALLAAVGACRLCRDEARHGPALPHEPRPVLQASPTALLCIAGQAPGTRVHASGRPFDDASGARLRAWLGLDEPTFYDATHVAIVPMAFCFPGQRPDGSDLPPRRECVDTWRAPLLARLPRLQLVLAVGGHAHRWHLGPTAARRGVTATVRDRRPDPARPSIRVVPLPHPSWHNTRWLKQNPWFEADLLPTLRAEIGALLDRPGPPAEIRGQPGPRPTLSAETTAEGSEG